ncbi:MAG: class I SAM-dependent methyltransferase [Myxococcota bacterium]|nr:class I SAM-dependent methyltransferase [Myxococcota bacterium]
MRDEQEVRRLFVCPTCRAGNTTTRDAQRCFHPAAPLPWGQVIDAVGDSAPAGSWGARAMQSRWLARIYESWWRPIAFGLSTGWRMPTPQAEAALVLAKLEGTRGPWLDLSCGPGQVTRRLIAHAGDRLVVAVDLSRAMLARVGVNAPRAVRVRADAASLPFVDAAFGAIVNLAALDLYADAARAVAEAARVLAPGGRWIGSTFVSSGGSSDERARLGTPAALWARAAGLRTPTEGALRALVVRAGLVRFDSVRFGSYVVAWADKEPES